MENEASNECVYDRLSVALNENFGRNAATAMIVVIAMIMRTMSVIVLGPSGGGKSTLVKWTAKLMPKDRVIFASRMSGAALYAMKPGQLKVVVNDELIMDKTFEKIRRMLISDGEAEAYLSTPSGELRVMRVEGPVGFIECALQAVGRDHQDVNRVVCVRLSDDPNQFYEYATATAQRHTLHATNDIGADLRRHIEQLVGAVDSGRIPVMPEEFGRIVPYMGLPHLSRRITQVASIASGVAVLRGGSETVPEQANMANVREALRLLIEARVADDQPTLKDDAAMFLRLMGRLTRLIDSDNNVQASPEPITLTALIERLNRRFSDEVEFVADVSKRHPKRSGLGGWTRCIVTARLLELENNGLLERWGRRPIFVKITQLGADFLASGTLNIFEAMRKEAAAL